MTEPKQDDSFSFDGGHRGVPDKHEIGGGDGRVKNVCTERCEEEMRMGMFESTKGGVFGRMDVFTVSAISFFFLPLCGRG